MNCWQQHAVSSIIFESIPERESKKDLQFVQGERQKTPPYKFGDLVTHSVFFFFLDRQVCSQRPDGPGWYTYPVALPVLPATYNDHCVPQALIKPDKHVHYKHQFPKIYRSMLIAM